LAPLLSIMPNRKKGKGRAMPNVIQSSDEGEVFDFNVTDSSIGDHDDHTRTAHGSRRSRPQAAPAVSDSVPTVVAPIAPTPPAVPPIDTEAAKLLALPTTGSSRSNQAQDINYFYSKREIDVKGVMTVRKVCTLCW
jgi:hypothetical protein